MSNPTNKKIDRECAVKYPYLFLTNVVICCQLVFDGSTFMHVLLTNLSKVLKILLLVHDRDHSHRNPTHYHLSFNTIV